MPTLTTSYKSSADLVMLCPEIIHRPFRVWSLVPGNPRKRRCEFGQSKAGPSYRSRGMVINWSSQVRLGSTTLGCRELCLACLHFDLLIILMQASSIAGRQSTQRPLISPLVPHRVSQETSFAH